MVTACIQAAECLRRVSHYSLAASCPAQPLRLSRLQPRRPISVMGNGYSKRYVIIACFYYACDGMFVL